MCDVVSENDDDFQDNGRIVWQNERIVPALSVSGQINESLRPLWLKSFFRGMFPLSQEKEYKECEKSRKSSTLLSCWRKNQGCSTGFLMEALEWRKTWWAQCFNFKIFFGAIDCWILNRFLCLSLLISFWCLDRHLHLSVCQQECGKSSMSPILVVAQRSSESLLPLQLFSLIQYEMSKYLVSSTHMEAFFSLFFV